MSCFQGQMNEYKNIALDRFDGKNLKCTAFFLSHCHKDHMVGLSFSTFHERLKSRTDVLLYCTEISRLLLSADADYCHLEKYITVLDVGEPRPIRIPGTRENKEDTYVTVTPISAGHCLGSVMFLFEGSEGAVIYTGDFRWEENQAARIAAFQYQNSVKTIRSMYVDTTFCIPGAFHIPSRNECVEAAYNLIADWLDKGLCNAVSISCPARYGHEHFLLELAKRLCTKIHMPSWKIDVYNKIPELQGYFTDDATETKIHSCAIRSGFTKTSVLPCGHQLPNGERLRLLNIRPSTMWFTSSKTKCCARDLVVSPATQRGLHRVCYSMHSSYSEIRDLISFIKPEKVSPNVLPASDKDMTAVQKRLESFIEHPNKFRLQSISTSDEGRVTLKPLGALRQLQRNTTHHSRAELFESGSDDLVFSSQECSPSKTSSTLQHSTKATAITITATSNLARHKDSQASSSSPTSPLRSDISMELHSSYSGSVLDDNNGELDLFSDEDILKEGGDLCLPSGYGKFDDGEDKLGEPLVKESGGGDIGEGETQEESLRSYVSGESEVEDESDNDNDNNEKIVGCLGEKRKVDSVVSKISCDKDNLDLRAQSVSSITDVGIDAIVKTEDFCNRIAGVGESSAVSVVDVCDYEEKIDNDECESTISYDVTESSLNFEGIVGHPADCKNIDMTGENLKEDNKKDSYIRSNRIDNGINCFNSNEASDVDDDIIPNSQEIASTDIKDTRCRIFRTTGHRSQNLTVLASGSVSVNYPDKDENSYSHGLNVKEEKHQDQYHNQQNDFDSSDSNSNSNAGYKLDKCCEDSIRCKFQNYTTAQNVLSNKESGDELEVEVLHSSHRFKNTPTSGSQPNVIEIDVEEIKSFDDCVEILEEDQTSSTPSLKVGWLSKSKTKGIKRRHQKTNVDVLCIEAQSKSNLSAKRKRGACESVRNSKSSSSKGRNRNANVDSKCKDTNDSPVVDLTLDDSQ